MNRLKTILKGLWIGSTMTVPGVSGGTMAILINIYDELICSINGVFRNPKKYVPFLLWFLIGSGAGFLAFAKVVTYLLESAKWGVPTQFFFCGVVGGGIPFFMNKIHKKDLSWKFGLSFLAGLGVVIALIFVPQGLFMNSSSGSGILLQFLGGILVAAALVLPGISVTHMLFILGLYEPVMQAVSNLDLLGILPLVVGVVAGTFMTAGLVEKCMSKYPHILYIMILGFVIGSLWELVPKEKIYNPLLCIVVLLIGFGCMYLVTNNMSEKKVED